MCMNISTSCLHVEILKIDKVHTHNLMAVVLVSQVKEEQPEFSAICLKKKGNYRIKYRIK